MDFNESTPIIFAFNFKNSLNLSDVFSITENPVWRFSWEEARKIVVESFASFDPEFGTVVENMFVNERIDSANRKGKTSGAFCARYGKAKSSFVFTSYNETMTDLNTLAHELFILFCPDACFRPL